jgi:hypothetical protein
MPSIDGGTIEGFYSISLIRGYQLTESFCPFPFPLQPRPLAIGTTKPLAIPNYQDMNTYRKSDIGEAWVDRKQLSQLLDRGIPLTERLVGIQAIRERRILSSAQVLQMNIPEAALIDLG